jgi:hypothetical protein
VLAATAEGVLLHATPDLIERLTQPDHMEGVQHGDRLRKAVVDRVGVASERVEGGLCHAIDEVCWLSVQPGLVGASGAAHDGIEQTSMQASAWSRDRSTMMVTARSTRSATAAKYAYRDRGLFQPSVDPGRSCGPWALTRSRPKPGARPSPDVWPAPTPLCRRS